jgi:hypothetical protein
VDELDRLLRADVIIGVATGRGKSVHQRLQEGLAREHWERVVVGYYNGGDVALLNDDSRPNGEEASAPPELRTRIHQLSMNLTGINIAGIILRTVLIPPDYAPCLKQFPIVTRRQGLTEDKLFLEQIKRLMIVLDLSWLALDVRAVRVGQLAKTE